MLENSAEDLAGRRIGLFSYGSGCMGSFFSLEVQPGYREALPTALHQHLLSDRTKLSFEEYERFYGHTLPTDGTRYLTACHDTGDYRLAGVEDHKRCYERVGAQGAPASVSAEMANA